VLERVIENWLVSLNERQYQIPFCQLLQAEGEKILKISRHQADELGVDILTLGEGDEVRAYQLKRGDIALSDWRANEGEIVQLVEYDPAHSGIPSDSIGHKSFLVTNGQFKGSVLNAIQQRNITWGRRNLGPLASIAKDELVSRFVEANGRFFPSAVEDVSLFFELFTERGQTPLNKQKFASFLESVLPNPSDQTIERRHVLQAASSIVLFTSYILKNKTLDANHWGLFEGWTMAAAYIAALGDEMKSAWEFSFSLCLLQATDALATLVEECDKNQSLSQGFTLSDVFIHPTRRLIVAGLMAGFYLATTGDSSQTSQRAAAIRVLSREAGKPEIWGESAFPFLYVLILAFEQIGRQAFAEDLARSAIHTICHANTGSGIGLPNPYWGPERCLRSIHNLSRHEVERFTGFSYSLEFFVEFLARRWRRVALRLAWPQITKVSYAVTKPANERAWLLWQSDRAELQTLRPYAPESWEYLRERSENRNVSALPPILQENRQFAIFFCLVYPHRMQPITAANLEMLLS
jgi:hypothetical protein